MELYLECTFEKRHCQLVVLEDKRHELDFYSGLTKALMFNTVFAGFVLAVTVTVFC